MRVTYIGRGGFGPGSCHEPGPKLGHSSRLVAPTGTKASATALVPVGATNRDECPQPNRDQCSTGPWQHEPGLMPGIGPGLYGNRDEWLWSSFRKILFLLVCLVRPNRTYPTATMLHLAPYQPCTDVHCLTPCRNMIPSRRTSGYSEPYAHVLTVSVLSTVAKREQRNPQEYPWCLPGARSKELHAFESTNSCTILILTYAPKVL